METQNCHFNKPTQVVFADPDNAGEWIVGIAYRDEIICACCGGIFEIGEVVEQAVADGVINPIYPYKEWNDISCEIIGGEFPEGLTVVNDALVEGIVVPTDDEIAITDAEDTECDTQYLVNFE